MFMPSANFKNAFTLRPEFDTNCGHVEIIDM